MLPATARLSYACCSGPTASPVALTWQHRLPIFPCCQQARQRKNNVFQPAAGYASFQLQFRGGPLLGKADLWGETGAGSCTVSQERGSQQEGGILLGGNHLIQEAQQRKRISQLRELAQHELALEVASQRLRQTPYAVLRILIQHEGDPIYLWPHLGQGLLAEVVACLGAQHAAAAGRDAQLVHPLPCLRDACQHEIHQICAVTPAAALACSPPCRIFLSLAGN